MLVLSQMELGKTLNNSQLVPYIFQYDLQLVQYHYPQCKFNCILKYFDGIYKLSFVIFSKKYSKYTYISRAACIIDVALCGMNQ